MKSTWADFRRSKIVVVCNFWVGALNIRGQAPDSEGGGSDFEGVGGV